MDGMVRGGRRTRHNQPMTSDERRDPALAEVGRPSAGARLGQGAVTVLRVVAVILFLVFSILAMLGLFMTVVAVIMGFTEGAWDVAAFWAGGTLVVWLLTWGSYRCTGPGFRSTVRGPGDTLEVLDLITLPFQIVGLIGRLFS